MNVNLYSLIYLSRATAEPTEPELRELLRISRLNNERDNLTGMLLFKEGRYMQLLEGPKEAVCATFARIASDPRHDDTTILFEGAIKERDFEDWSMGFQTLEGESARAIPGFSPFLDAEFSVFEFASDPSRAHQLFRIFRRM